VDLVLSLCEALQAALVALLLAVRLYEEEEECCTDPQEASRCRALLLEVVRRAAHDWILYRTSARLPMKQVAEEAYTWLFEEEPGHPWWRMRERNGCTLMSLISICEQLDLDPEFVREKIRKLTVQQIILAGRPAERRTGIRDDAVCSEFTIFKPVDIDSLEEPGNYDSTYEAQFAVTTPSFL
jgi:hypothetical protein